MDWKAEPGIGGKHMVFRRGTLLFKFISMHLKINKTCAFAVLTNQIFMRKNKIGQNHFWAAIWSIEIIRPYFFFKILMESVNVERYLNLLKRTFLPALQQNTTNFSRSSVWYQQDGATCSPRTATRVLMWLDDTFSWRYLSHKTENHGHHIPLVKIIGFFPIGVFERQSLYRQSWWDEVT